MTCGSAQTSPSLKGCVSWIFASAFKAPPGLSMVPTPTSVHFAVPEWPDKHTEVKGRKEEERRASRRRRGNREGKWGSRASSDPLASRGEEEDGEERTRLVQATFPPQSPHGSLCRPSGAERNQGLAVVSPPAGRPRVVRTGRAALGQQARVDPFSCPRARSLALSPRPGRKEGAERPRLAHGSPPPFTLTPLLRSQRKRERLPRT